MLLRRNPVLAVAAAAFIFGALPGTAAEPTAPAVPGAPVKRPEAAKPFQGLKIRLSPVYDQDSEGQRLVIEQLALRTGLATEDFVPNGDGVVALAPASIAKSTRSRREVLSALRQSPEILWAEPVKTNAREGKPPRTNPKRDPDEPTISRFFVIFAAGSLTESTDLDELRVRIAGATGSAITSIRASALGRHVVELADTVTAERARAIADSLVASGIARRATPSYPVEPYFVPNDTFVQDGTLWSLSSPYLTDYWGIDAYRAWDITTGSPNIVVAVIDTGVVPHTDLADKLIAGYDFISSAAGARDGDGRDGNPLDQGNWNTASECSGRKKDSNWHGTHVAGTIGASANNGRGIAGVSWGARIQPVRVLGRCGGDRVDIIEAMMWAAGIHIPGVPDNPTPARVINMSLGGEGTCDDNYQDAVNAVLARGALVVAAAGNEDDDAGNYAPASCYGLSTVGATDWDGHRASYSNYSFEMDISAPGGDKTRHGADGGIYSTVDNSTTTPSGTYVYDSYQGTSMAAPHVSGVTALMLSVNPSLTPAQLKDLMALASTDFPSTSQCNEGYCGAGIVNAYWSVRFAQNAATQSAPIAVEYFNSRLGHYFISPLQAEIAALDSGDFADWRRTGQGFKVFVPNTPGAAPVCRYFRQDVTSHFYSALPQECAAAAGFRGWVFETGNLFGGVIPNTLNGACPNGTIPLYRLWNRAVNHRYTTSTAVKSAMQGRGYVPEGYGPGVAMCLPE